MNIKQLKEKYGEEKIVKPKLKQPKSRKELEKDLIKRVEEIEKKLNGIKGFN